jgi:hypothetical protein
MMQSAIDASACQNNSKFADVVDRIVICVKNIPHRLNMSSLQNNLFCHRVSLLANPTVNF